MDFQPTVPTLVFTSIFLIVYSAILIRRTARYKIDLYDFLLLLTVAMVPVALVYFPSVWVAVARTIGVAFPFVLLFGLLFLIVYVYLYRLVIKMNQQGGRIVVLAQELSMLRESLEQLRKDASRES